MFTEFRRKRGFILADRKRRKVVEGGTEDLCKLGSDAGRGRGGTFLLWSLVPGPRPAAPGELEEVIGGSSGLGIDDCGALISRKHKGLPWPFRGNYPSTEG